jgi:cytochrome b6-f complex iron-sulfur subunit
MEKINRRTFLKSVGACTLCSSSTAIIFASTGKFVLANEYITITDKKVIVDKAAFSGKRSIVFSLPEFDYPISLLQIDKDNYSALLMMCTHQKCKTEWNKDHYVCPCHGSRFTETGEVIRGLAEESLKSYPVAVAENKIIIQIK